MADTVASALRFGVSSEKFDQTVLVVIVSVVGLLCLCVPDCREHNKSMDETVNQSEPERVNDNAE
jgi:hypothetical protein